MTKIVRRDFVPDIEALRGRFEVTERSSCPPIGPGRCCYCRAAVGDTHNPDCVLIHRDVWLGVYDAKSHELLMEVPEALPAYWDEEMIYFCRNEASWCANNILRNAREHAATLPDEARAPIEAACTRLQAIADADTCICNHVFIIWHGNADRDVYRSKRG